VKDLSSNQFRNKLILQMQDSYIYVKLTIYQPITLKLIIIICCFLTTAQSNLILMRKWRVTIDCWPKRMQQLILIIVVIDPIFNVKSGID